MHIYWLTLETWFLAAIGFFAVGIVVVSVMGRGSSGTLIQFVIYAIAQWIFVMGVVRSASLWSLSICGVVGLAVFPVIYLLMCIPADAFVC